MVAPRHVFALALLINSVPVQAFPLGVGYETTTSTLKIGENLKENNYGSFTFKATYHTFSVLDYTGLACAGMQTTGSMVKAREEALEAAPYSEEVRRTGKITYTYEAAAPTAGATCGVKYHMARSENNADIGGSTIDNRGGAATVSGWTAFGGGGAPFEFDPNLFWKLMLAVDLRTIKILDVPPEEEYMSRYTFDEMIIAMPIDYEIGGVINIPDVAGFMAWGSVGYDMIFWLMKAMFAEYYPTSFIRLGAGIGYQTPVTGLQVRLSYKNTDSFIDSRGLRENGYTFGVYYQM